MLELPPSLRPPIPLALAKAVENIPPADPLPGGCLYEPKWDGFRAGVFSDSHGAAIWSRSARDLSGRFPDLTSAVHGQLPPGYVLDAEAVIWSGERTDFTALQARMTGGRKILHALIRRAPASLARLDLLAVAGRDIRNLPLHIRRELLEELALGWEPPLNLSPVTADRETAEQWFTDLPAAALRDWSSKVPIRSIAAVNGDG